MNHHYDIQTTKAHGTNFWGLTVLGWVLITLGCASPLPISLQATGNTGTLTIAMPHIAAWAAHLASSRNAGSDHSRAYIVADKVVVEVRNTAGAAVIPPTTIELAMVTDYSPAYPVTPSAISGIPVGSDYTVVVSVYNLAVSSDQPVVRGQTSGVAVTLGETTPVAITCLPVSPETIAVDNGPWVKPLAPNGEHWYALEVTSGASYYIVNNVPMALFSAGGVAQSYATLLPYVATYTGTVYLGVVDFNGYAGFSSLGSSVLNVTTIEPVTNEGMPNNPVPLTLNSNHSFLLGPAQGSYGSSYYSFTTTTAGDYVLDSDLNYFYATLYSDSMFTTALGNSSNSVDFGLYLGNLAVNTTYYLKLRNGSTSRQTAAGQVMDASGVSSNYQGQGTLAAPVPLALGTPQAAQVGTHFFDANSYYSFTTGAGTDYAIEVSALVSAGTSMTLTLFDSSSFNNTITRQQFVNSGTLFAKLAPSTTYYLKAANDYNGVRSNISPTFNLSVGTGVSAPNVVDGSIASPDVVALNSTRTFKVANSGSGYSSYYQFTTTGAGDYALDTELTGLDTYLYSDSGFSTIVSSSTSGRLGKRFTGLAAETTYYLRLSGTNTSPQSSLGQIVDSTTMAAQYGADGSMVNPASVTIGTPYLGKVGNHSYDDLSFYSFTTGAGVEYTINLSGIPSGKSVIAAIHGNATYTDQMAYDYFPKQGQGSLAVMLAPYTTYYIQTRNYPSNGDVSIPYQLSVNAAPTPPFLPLEVTSAGADYQSGDIATPFQVVWYEATVVPGTTYALTWDSKYGGSGTYTGDVDVSVYHANRFTAYFMNATGGFTSARTVTVPADETKLYIRVRAYYGSSSTGTFGIKLY